MCFLNQSVRVAIYLFRLLCLGSLFVFISILTMILLGWGAHAVLGRYLTEPWMFVILLCLGTFLGGVLTRHWVERYTDPHHGLPLFLMACLAQGAFALMTWWDIQHIGISQGWTYE